MPLGSSRRRPAAPTWMRVLARAAWVRYWARPVCKGTGIARGRVHTHRRVRAFGSWQGGEMMGYGGRVLPCLGDTLMMRCARASEVFSSCGSGPYGVLPSGEH